MATETNTYTLQPGDVVRLKSGGPRMTVSAVNGNEAQLVYWNDQTSEFETWEEVNMVALEKVEVPA
jgi:uncharacterized protein YodC (DUF2158 family)